MREWCTEGTVTKTERTTIYILAKSAGCKVSPSYLDEVDKYCSIIHDHEGESPIVIFTYHFRDIELIPYKEAIEYFKKLIKYRDNGEGEDTSNAD